MMRGIPAVALDISVGGFNRGGSGSYCRWLTGGLAALMGDRLHCVGLPRAGDRLGPRNWRTRMGALRHDLWWTQFGVTRAARRVRAELLHAPSAFAPMRSSIPLVVTIHDLSMLRFPAEFPRWFRTWSALTIPRIASNAALVITDSLASRDDLLQEWRALEDRISVIPLGVPPPDASWDDPARVARVRSQYGLARPFVLTVSSQEPRKNIPRLLKAIHQLRADAATRDMSLVHAGPPGSLHDEIPETVRALGLSDAVRFIGYVPEADLSALYGMARVTVYTSLFEGFGLPIVEAMRRGSPVVTSRVSSMPEVAGDAAILVDPTNVDEIADAIRRLWLEEDLRRRYQLSGFARSAQFSVENMARGTLDAYRRVVG